MSGWSNVGAQNAKKKKSREKAKAKKAEVAVLKATPPINPPQHLTQIDYAIYIALREKFLADPTIYWTCEELLARIINDGVVDFTLRDVWTSLDGTLSDYTLEKVDLVRAYRLRSCKE